MYKLFAFWSSPEAADVAAFEEHYNNIHVPKAAAVPKLRRLVATRTPHGLEGGEPAFYRVAEMAFDSPADMAASEESAEWAAMRADAGEMIERFGISLSVCIGQEQVADLEGRAP